MLLYFFSYLTLYRLLILFVLSQVTRESTVGRFLPGTRGREAVTVSFVPVRLTQAGGPAETHVCQFLQCLLTDFYLKGDAI